MPGGFLWSPKTRADGVRYYFYDTFSKAIGVVQKPAVPAPKPDFRTAGSNWSKTGWFVQVEFSTVDNPVRPKDFMVLIGPLLADKYAPLLPNGNGLQSIYLTEVSTALGELLLQLSSVTVADLNEDLSPVDTLDIDAAIDFEIKARHLDGDLEAIQLVKARRGQGVFRANVRLVEARCRVTGVADKRHLRASHIKPWADSTSDEKIDGFNGLLLSPHVDHLFDRGFISFKNEGRFLVSRDLSPEVLRKWSIDSGALVGGFHRSQQGYLDYHRDVVFRG